MSGHMKFVGIFLILSGLALLGRSVFLLTIPGFQIETPLLAMGGMFMLTHGIALTYGVWKR
jgi:hypothetical protein